MSELNHISYITLWVKNYDACLAFYRDQLGLALEGEDGNLACFQTKGTRLCMHRLVEAPPLRSRALEIHFEVPDVDASYRMLVERGIPFESEPANMPWGTRMAALRDPEGFSIEIVGPLK
jgi:lactoylglutathione lyase